MRKLLLCLAVIVALIVIGGRATAVPVYFGDGGASPQKELNNITIYPIPGKSSKDVTKDALMVWILLGQSMDRVRLYGIAIHVIGLNRKKFIV